MHRTDDELIDAFLAGEDKAFTHIVHRHRQRLTHVARRYTNNDSDAQDIVQEAFLRASTALAKYRRDAQLSTWLYRLVKNAGYDYLNHRANRENPSLDSGAFDPDRNPALAYETGTELRLIIEDALSQLRPDHQEVLYMMEVAGYSLADVARIQGVRTGTVKSRRHRAKEALRAAMG